MIFLIVVARGKWIVSAGKRSGKVGNGQRKRDGARAL